MLNQWNKESLNARISDRRSGQRFEAASPNEAEINAYAGALPRRCSKDTAVVLGMTPELRLLAAKLFTKVFTVDYSRDAIQIYSDWLAEPYRRREVIIHGHWFDLPKYVPHQVSVIFGDGVFGNLLNVEEHYILLKVVASVLSAKGCFITRKVLIPDGFTPQDDTAEKIIERFRARQITEAEFGFDMRILGHYNCCYNAETFILDNKKLFEECRQFLHSGKITRQEFSIIRRYYFPGKNCIVPQSLWEKLLNEHSFKFVIQQCCGKTWYRYYKIYQCIPVRCCDTVA